MSDNTRVIARIGLLNRKPDITPSQFKSYWLDTHSRFGRSLSSYVIYYQNHVVKRLSIQRFTSCGDFDGFSQVLFRDFKSMHESMTPDLSGEIIEDETHFLGDIHLTSSIRHSILPRRKGSDGFKTMWVSSRREDVNADAFMSAWTRHHTGLVERLPNVVAYTQNLVFDRADANRCRVSREEFPVDGIEELWFESEVSFNAMIASQYGQAMMSHLAGFSSDLSVFHVDEHAVVV